MVNSRVLCICLGMSDKDAAPSAPHSVLLHTCMISTNSDPSVRLSRHKKGTEAFDLFIKLQHAIQTSIIHLHQLIHIHILQIAQSWPSHSQATVQLLFYSATPPRTLKFAYSTLFLNPKMVPLPRRLQLCQIRVPTLLGRVSKSPAIFPTM
jgi:hypothetical protein